MIVSDLELLVFILAAAIIRLFAFVHSTFAALFIIIMIIMPETPISQFPHAEMQMHGRSNGGRQVDNGQYCDNEFLHRLQMYRENPVTMLHNFDSTFHLKVFSQLFHLNIMRMRFRVHRTSVFILLIAFECHNVILRLPKDFYPEFNNRLLAFYFI